jgi:hypothetical protein
MSGQPIVRISSDEQAAGLDRSWEIVRMIASLQTGYRHPFNAFLDETL